MVRPDKVWKGTHINLLLCDATKSWCPGTFECFTWMSRAFFHPPAKNIDQSSGPRGLSRYGLVHSDPCLPIQWLPGSLGAVPKKPGVNAPEL